MGRQIFEYLPTYLYKKEMDINCKWEYLKYVLTLLIKRFGTAYNSVP